MNAPNDRNASSHSVAIAAGCLEAIMATPGAVAAEPTVVTRTQVPCQFLRGGTNLGYQSRSFMDCEAINAQSGTERVPTATVVKLKAGAYVFRVKNENEPYELGLWLRGAGVAGRLRLPSVSGGGLTEGKTQDYAITLKAGEYLYSCPLNTTPDYKLVVTR